MVIPFNTVYPPMNGGMQRCFNLLNQLCRHFEVTAIMHQDRDSFMQAAAAFPAIKNCRVISTKDNKKDYEILSLLPGKYGNAVKYRYWNRSLQGPAGSHFLALYPPMKAFLKTSRVDAVILEDMEIVNLAKLVKRYQPGTPVIYDAYNVNTILAAAQLEKREISRSLFELIQRDESAIFKSVDKVFACSEIDLVQLRRMNQDKINGVVIPNGVVMPKEAPATTNKPGADATDILFCGAMDYSPNREGLGWFLKSVFPLILSALPGARLLVVGRGDPGAELSILLQHPSIKNYGRVETVDSYYRQAAVAIVPLLSGSGTRLKLLEAMAYGTAIVSTEAGAEGIAYAEGKNILLANDPQLFAERVVTLLNNPSFAADIATNAFSFVQKTYDWDIVGDTMAAYLQTLHN